MVQMCRYGVPVLLPESEEEKEARLELVAANPLQQREERHKNQFRQAAE